MPAQDCVKILSMHLCFLLELEGTLLNKWLWYLNVNTFERLRRKAMLQIFGEGWMGLFTRGPLL